MLIDGLNLAYWCGNPPSLRLPLAAMIHLRSAGADVRTYFDASARYRLQAEAALYTCLMQYPDDFIEAASGRTADGLLLRHARSGGACILSRDKYRDHRRRFRKLIDDPLRLISGFVQHDRLQVPALAMDAALPSSAAEAWTQLEPLLAATRTASLRDPTILTETRHE